MMQQPSATARPTCPAGHSLRQDSDAFAFYRLLQTEAESPVWDADAQAWLVFDYDQIAAVHADPATFGNAYIFADDTLRAIKGGGANITLSQGVEHDRLRKMHLRLLSPSHVDRYRKTHVEPIADAALDRIQHESRIDAAAQIADRIPPRVICSMLGIPNDDDEAMDRLLELNGEIVDLIASGYRDPARRDRALAASAELNDVLRPYVRLRRDNPADDFISRVWQEAASFGIDLDEDAALGLCRELYFAGSDTTVYGIANAIFTLLSEPGLLEAARADRNKALAGVVEESLRLIGVVQYRHRICMADATIGAVPIAKGDAVLVLHAAANRDPGHYACAEATDVTRRSPTDHFAFGRGNRSCVGAQLARVEMRYVLDRMLDRFPDLRLDPSAPKPAFTGTFMAQMRPVHIILKDQA